MKVIVNGEAQDVAAETLSELLVLMEYEGDRLATAVNGELVHREDRFNRSLNDNDRIEILSPMQGG
ncbi:sulfur carrier protein ThiS [Rhizobium leguminosarum]|uniref:sulfur carrier protein ThiS n=1 Tax=Rhizobium leguminosarum TaxID=384 RepID=UPI001C8FD40F|nr:sulfur carrier protein ThiS [Rhizobium leguminosarum]MBY3027436.1 sulfur carrier protein ThiS [Rhizobium leguminosarum]